MLFKELKSGERFIMSNVAKGEAFTLLKFSRTLQLKIEPGSSPEMINAVQLFNGELAIVRDDEEIIALCECSFAR